MKKIIFLTFICLTISCGTLFTGTTETISFNSEPEKAEIQFDGFTVGKTPYTMEVKKSFNGIVSMKKDGYETEQFKLQKSFNGVSILNLTNLLGWAVDFATGALNKFDRKGYQIELEKEN